MAHEIGKLDRVVIGSENGRDRGWHGLGIPVQGLMSLADAVRQSGIADWQAVGCAVAYQHPATGEWIELPGQAVVRGDKPHVVLAPYTGERRRIHQYSDMAQCLQPVLDSAGAAIETIGTLRNGALFWAAARLPEGFGIRRANGTIDSHAQYLVLMGSHDTTRAQGWCLTTVRVVCANTLRAAQARGSNMRRKQTAGLLGRLDTDARALGDRLAEQAETVPVLQRLADTPMSRDDYRSFVGELLDATATGRERADVVSELLGAADPAFAAAKAQRQAVAAELLGSGDPTVKVLATGPTRGEKRSETIRARKLAMFEDLYQTQSGGQDRFGALQSVTYAVDHGLAFDTRGDSAAKAYRDVLNALLPGSQGDKLKATAFSMLAS